MLYSGQKEPRLTSAGIWGATGITQRLSAAEPQPKGTKPHFADAQEILPKMHYFPT